MKEFIEKLNIQLEKLITDTYYKAVGGNKSAGIENNAYHNVKNMVNQFAKEHKSNSLEKLNSWIPCSERLPDVKKEVLIFADDNAMFVGRLMNGGFIVHDGDGWIDLKFILAWQPLPEPYQPKGE